MPVTPLVLIVDDDLDTREMYGWCLEAHGYRVRLAGSMATALTDAADEVPDVVVTDYALPGGDGFALAGALRRSPGTSMVPLILVSGCSFAGQAREHAARLFDRVLIKPVSPEELATQVVMISGRAAVHLIN